MSSNHTEPHLNKDSYFIKIAPSQKIITVFFLALSLAFNDIRNTYTFSGILICILIYVYLSIESLKTLLKKMYIVIPFILFSFFLPFVGQGGEIYYLYKDIAIHENGLFDMINILFKSIAGVSMTIALSSTTSQFDIVKGLEKLRLPKILIAIISFSLRYINVYTSELSKTKQGMQSRGFENRSLKDSVSLAYAGSTMIIKGFERGEKVYSSMVSRGFNGALPASKKEWSYSKLLYLLCLISLIISIKDYYL